MMFIIIQISEESRLMRSVIGEFWQTKALLCPRKEIRCVWIWRKSWQNATVVALVEWQ